MTQTRAGNRLRSSTAASFLAFQTSLAGGLHAEPTDEEEPEFEAVAEVEAPPTEPTKRIIAEQQLTTLPGTRGDAVRAVEVLPGVGRTQFGSNPGAPPLRGSAPNESAVFFDGSATPTLYHFGGLTSVFNSHLLESVTLYPGNYSARYGRQAGGIIEARVRDPKAHRAHFKLELSLLDSFALAEGPTGQKTSVAVAARRSNVDLFVSSLIDDDSTAVLAAPVYWDYQAIVAHRFSSAHRLRAMAYGSYDSFKLFVGKAGEDPSLRGQIGARDSFHRLQVSTWPRKKRDEPSCHRLRLHRAQRGGSRQRDGGRLAAPPRGGAPGTHADGDGARARTTSITTSTVCAAARTPSSPI